MTAIGYLKSKLNRPRYNEVTINANAPTSVNQYTQSWAACDAIEAQLPSKSGLYHYNDCDVLLNVKWNGRKIARWNYVQGGEYYWEFDTKRGHESMNREWNGSYKWLGNKTGATKPQILASFGADALGNFFQGQAPFYPAIKVDSTGAIIADWKYLGTTVATIDSSGNFLKGSNRMMTLAELKTVVAASTDFADFQTRVAALT